MGCTPSKKISRPGSARSWMASEGWIITTANDVPATLNRTGSGKIVVNDSQNRVIPVEENPFDTPSRKDIIGIPPAIGFRNESTIVNLIETLKPGQQFRDPDFPPNDSSLFYSDKRDPDVVWLSPKDLVSQPYLYVDGMTRGDIMQGALGDCWFLSSCAAVCQKQMLMDRIIPDRQVLTGPDYKGVVRFRLWRYGRWVNVYIDDRLPTKDGQLIYARATDPNEFWVSLLEKAYAKLHGSFEAIEGGQSMDALVDLTGGIAERYELTEHTQDLYLKLSRASAAGAFITCSRKGNWKVCQNEVDENGLIAGHAYTVTDVKRIKRVNGSECLLRIRNPWGYGEEWKGAWSDKDHRWQLVDDETKKYLQFVQKGDGEFWMSYKDFCKHFQEVTICTVGPDFDGDGIADASNQILFAYGKWTEGFSAGGCRNDLKAFGTNPQFLLTVYEHDEQDPALLPNERRKETCSVIVALMQEHITIEKRIATKMLQIGFIMYKAEDPNSRLPTDHFNYYYETAKSGTYVNFREVCGRFELEPGYYVIIPSTYNKDESGEFMLRVFSRKRIALRELPEASAPNGTAARSNQQLEYDHHIVPPPVTEPVGTVNLFDVHNGENEWQPELPDALNQPVKRKSKVSLR